tara:strand:- start:229 stop:1152 length:924 start_codon:yes stop_codon:yes gene_type:complete
MKGVVNSINLGLGNISYDNFLGPYYQDIAPSLVHINNEVFAKLDNNGIPFKEVNGKKVYYVVMIIQYGIACYDLFCKNQNEEQNKKNVLAVLTWMDTHKENLNDSIVWRSNANKQYNIKKDWISGMYQGQAMSLYLRGFQLFNNSEYLKTADKIFKSFFIDFDDGGFKRIDDGGNIWFEEYPTEKPSLVLNGFIYAMFGILDYHRVTNSLAAKELWESCLKTLENNLKKYDVWYWSIYDQLKKQLVSYYYQKNIHIPLMEIMYELTKKNIFSKYAKKWKKNLNNPIHRLVVKIMYRIQPRINKLFKF